MPSLKRINLKYAAITAAFSLILILCDLLFSPPELKSFSKQIYSANGELLGAFLTSDDKWRMRTSIADVPEELITALLRKEDKYFYWHFGVNPVALVKSAYQNIAQGKVVSGASTITMQTIRMLEPRPRNILSKLIEVVRAFQFEIHYSKNEILEFYLSNLPYGGNIEGVKAASYIYFNKPPAKLSLAESVVLTVVPNDPNNLRPDKSTDNLNSFVKNYLNKFNQRGIFDSSIISDALEENISTKRHEIEIKTPHFCRYVFNNSSEEIVSSTLDLSIQTKAEKLLKNHVERNKNLQVSNGAVLIIDRKGKIKSYCGSADFYDNSNSGQVDGINSLRSPGSTLKPLLYTLAFDFGAATPGRKLLDIPTDFSGYEPENYDLKFNGYVSVKFALINSLNIPAVQILEEVKFSNFLNLLFSSGFNSIQQQRDKLGLSVILGGCGVTLSELVNGYLVIGNNGKYIPLSFSNSEIQNLGRNVLSEEAAFMTLNILSSEDRPEISNSDLLSDSYKFAWKTGTSYGRKDAWAIGITKNYIIGVWMGNFDGKGSAYLSGAQMAVPLLFDIAKAVDPNGELRKEIPADVLIRKVCAESGLLPGKHCQNLVDDFYIPNISSQERCTIESEYFVDSAETITYCSECIPENYKKKVFKNYDSKLERWMYENNLNLESPYPHNPECRTVIDNGELKILSPSPDFEYFTEKSNPDKIALIAVSSSEIKYLYWYINGKYYSKSGLNEKIFFTPKSEKISISCMDDRGRQDKIKLKISFF